MFKILRFWLYTALVSVLATIVILISVSGTDKPEFQPPEFDINVQHGEANVPEDIPYGTAMLGIYNVSIAAAVPVNQQQAYIFFANHATNNVWMKLRIFDSTGDIIGESGLVKPNEHLESVELKHIPADTSVVVKIMCYEPETYHSKGSSQITLPLI